MGEIFLATEHTEKTEKSFKISVNSECSVANALCSNGIQT